MKTFHDGIKRDDNKFCYGINCTMQAFEMGAIDTIIVYENVKIQRFVLKSPSNDNKKIVLLTQEQAKEETDQKSKR